MFILEEVEYNITDNNFHAGDVMPIKLEDIRTRLHAKDYKLTPQRQLIVKVFSENPNEHLSAEDVYGLVKEEHPEIGLATVYRTLDLLAQLDILRVMNFGDGRSRYELTDIDDHHHHHLICLQCGNVAEFNDDLLESLEAVVQKRNGFRVHNHQLKMYGICKECQSKDNEK
ncbi:MAG: fur [Peptococcaceae bacterium]|nr:fur [Peptococcaceae bacterium]